jgi:CO dehydrogenase nickel-insertion accessory protein CooC1
VDPSREAVILAEKASRLCGEAGKPFLVVVNKSDPESSASLRDMLLDRGLDPVSFIGYLPSLARANLEGTPLEAKEVRGSIAEIVSALKGDLVSPEQ